MEVLQGMIRSRTTRVSLIALAGAVCALAVIIFVSTRSARDGAAASLEEQWLQAVREGEPRAALFLAARIVGASAPAEPEQSYVRLAEREGMDASFLTAGFNGWDYQLWHQLLALQQIALQSTAGRAEPIQALFDAVTGRVESREPEPESPVIYWPYQIWQQRYGLCDRQAWLLGELAYQLGYEVQIVYLIDPEADPQSGSSPHTVCEIRSQAGDVWLADPYLRVLLPGTSTQALAADAELMESTWPGRTQLHRSMEHCILFTPSYPQDYCLRNQRLAQRLREVLGPRCPRFGEDPRRRGRRYLGLHEQATGREMPFLMLLWHYPWGRLAEEMALRTAQGAEPGASPTDEEGPVPETGP